MERRENFVALTKSNILNGRINTNDLMSFRHSELFEELMYKAGYNVMYEDREVLELQESLNKVRFYTLMSNPYLKVELRDELFDYVVEKIKHWYFDCDETKSYRVVAHCADGDVEIKPKGKDTFSTPMKQWKQGTSI